MKRNVKLVYFTIILIVSVLLHGYWLSQLKPGHTPGPVDPFLKIIQGYSLYSSNFSDQSLYYKFKDVDPDYEFCLFQRDIFTVKRGKDLLGPFPVSLSALIGFLLYLASPENLFYFFAIFNFLLYLLIFKNIHQTYITAFLVFFGLPFFVPNSEVSEHSILLLLQVSALSIFSFSLKVRKKDSSRTKLFFLSGILLGSAVFFRHEVLLFSHFFIFALVLFLLMPNQKSLWTKKDIFTFTVGVYLCFALFFLFNFIFYQNFLGPRLSANSKGIFSGLGEKLEYYKVLLWQSPPKYGFFGYSPVYFISFYLLYKYRKKFNSYNWVLFLSAVGLFVFVPLLAPNDGGAPWGPRYLFLAVFPMVYLTGRTLQFLKWKSTKIEIFLFHILFILAISYSVFIESKGIRSAIKVAGLQKQYIKDSIQDNVDLIVFTNELVSMQTGLSYLNYPMVLLSNEKQIPSFVNKFLSNEKFKTISLIEPKVDKLNLSAFSEEEKKGFFPTETIGELDKILKKIEIEEKTTVRVHTYCNPKSLGCK